MYPTNNMNDRSEAETNRAALLPLAALPPALLAAKALPKALPRTLPIFAAKTLAALLLGGSLLAAAQTDPDSNNLDGDNFKTEVETVISATEMLDHNNASSIFLHRGVDLAQTFTVKTAGTISGIDLPIHCNGAAPEASLRFNITVALHTIAPNTTAATFAPNADSQEASVTTEALGITQQQGNPSSVATSFTRFEFSTSQHHPVAVGDQLAIVFSPGTSFNCRTLIRKSQTLGYDGGEAFIKSDDSWGAITDNADLPFGVLTVTETADNCPTISNNDQADADDDGVGDVCDNCIDVDNGPGESDSETVSQNNIFGIRADGSICSTRTSPPCTKEELGGGDACQDIDSDNTVDSADNCPAIANDDQVDTYGSGLNSNFASDGSTCRLGTSPGGIACQKDKIGDACDNSDGDMDSDGDPIYDREDNCPLNSNPEQTETYGIDSDTNARCKISPDKPNCVSNNIGDLCDNSDGDAHRDNVDNCPLVADDTETNTYGKNAADEICTITTENAATCSDEQGDVCGDIDGDAAIDNVDNCPMLANADQANFYGVVQGLSSTGVCTHVAFAIGAPVCSAAQLGRGDACTNSDGDMDGDGNPIYDHEDNCPTMSNGAQENADGDLLGDACDTAEDDNDGDGVLDGSDTCDGTPPTVPSAMINAEGCAPNQINSDDDTIFDDLDNCPMTTNQEQTDSDEDGEGDACDTDDDNDDVLDAADNCPGTPSDETAKMMGDADVIATEIGCSDSQIDSDCDGVFNDVDNCDDVVNRNQFNRGGGTAAGDACEDRDNDGVLDQADRCPNTSTPSATNVINRFGCSAAQAADPNGDEDRDNILNPVDVCPYASNVLNQNDTDGNGIGDVCDDQDGDGIFDNIDSRPTNYDPEQPAYACTVAGADDGGFCFPVMGDDNTAVVCL